MFRFHKIFFLVSSIIFLVEVAIAAFLEDGFIRHTFGDYLVVMLIYCVVRCFTTFKPLPIALGTLLFAFAVEFSQLLHILDVLDLRQHKLAVIIMGSTFQITDLIAYSLGVITIYLIDLNTQKQWKP